MQEDLESFGQWKLGEEPTVLGLSQFLPLSIAAYYLMSSLDRFAVMVVKYGCMRNVTKFPATFLRSVIIVISDFFIFFCSFSFLWIVRA